MKVKTVLHCMFLPEIQLNKNKTVKMFKSPLWPVMLHTNHVYRDMNQQLTYSMQTSYHKIQTRKRLIAGIPHIYLHRRVLSLRHVVIKNDKWWSTNCDEMIEMILELVQRKKQISLSLHFLLLLLFILHWISMFDHLISYWCNISGKMSLIAFLACTSSLR